MKKKLNVFANAAVASAVLVGGVAVGGVNVFAEEGAADEGNKEYQSNAIVEFEPSTDKTDPTDPNDPDGKPVGPIDPTDPDGPKPGTDGPLSIDYASSLDFGKQKITSADEVYTAKAQKFTELADGPNYVQVTDNRGTESGWTLKVKQEAQFKTADGKELTGAAITFTNGVVNTVSESPKPSIFANKVTLVPGTEASMLAAKDGEGAGTHVLAFGNNDTAAESIKLAVPGKSTKYAKKYSTQLTWTLSDTPGADAAEGNE
ncbi:WxL domain-containing protein [Listeria kieliensis]|uniref:Cell surface protein n=1 Tax=Listeria kieliensis TaxID=1621700 RepID=A0A3D8TQP0_9LIST|nr:WxL domain-containing protein [Listeria kieliensis]RDX01007.1 cell surface protein [Listeria kieliensis]